MIRHQPSDIVKLYKNNMHLMAADQTWEYTPEEFEEWMKCAQDPVYFATNYIKITHVDRGIIPFEMWDFQKEMMTLMHENRFVIGKLSRQVGKSLTTVSYILWYILFNEAKNVGILANKGSLAREILGRLILAYENLPFWLQQGVKIWNKGNIALGNGSEVKAMATSSSAARGSSFSLLMLDEFAFLHPNQAEAFFESVYPTISSGTETKMIVVSTPNGLNHFYRMWEDAEKERSEFKTFSINWWDVPGRDDAWKAKIISTIGEESFRQEYGCDFMGSSNSLISPSVLSRLVFKEPLYKNNNGVNIYENPIEDHSYVTVVDCAEGVGFDYSTFSVIDVSTYPYKQVATFRSNKVTPLFFPDIISTICRGYNNSFVVIELNSVGSQVANHLAFELEYEEVAYVGSGKHGQILMGGQNQLPGVKTSKQTKKVGCANLKDLIENDKLIVNDFDTISELSTFVHVKSSFEAEEGCHDDTVMPLVLFGWCVNQEYFKALKDHNLRTELYAEKARQMEDDVIPFIGTLAYSAVDDGPQIVEVDKAGVVWYANN